MIGSARATAESGAIALSVEPGRAWQLECIKVHLNAAGGAGSLTAKVDAEAGAVYDVVVLTQDMTAATDVVYIPTRPIPMDAGDKLIVAWPNAGDKTYGVEVKYSLRGA